MKQDHTDRRGFAERQDRRRHRRRRRWRRLRVGFRSARLVIWSVVLIAAVALFYLNKIGLPAPVKDRLLAELRSQGWAVEFSRLRWRWDHGIVAEDLHLQNAVSRSGPNLFLEEAQCRLRRAALWKGRLELEGFVLEEGRLVWLLASTNQPRRYVQFNDIQGELWFHPDDRWEVRGVQASGLGARFVFNGTLRHAAAMRHWSGPGLVTQPTVSADRRWQQIFQQIDRVQVQGVPELTADFSGDARDWRSIQARFTALVPSLRSPWGQATNLNLSLQLFPDGAAEHPLQVELSGGADQVVTPWGQAEFMRLYFIGEPSYDRLVSTNVHLALEVQGGQTPWGRAALAMLTARTTLHPTNHQWRLTEGSFQAENLLTHGGQGVQGRLEFSLAHPLTNVFPNQWSARLQGREIQSRWGRAQNLAWQGEGTLASAPRWADTNLNWPERFRSLTLTGSGAATNLQAAGLEAGWINWQSAWQAPNLQCSGSAFLGEGPASWDLSANTDSRLVSFTAQSQFNPSVFRTMLHSNGQAWLDRYSWDEPPRLRVQGSLQLPDWNQPAIRWREDIRPHLMAQGQFEVGYGTYLGVPFLSAQADFHLRNENWEVHNVRVAFPEGSIRGDYSSHLRTRDFQWQVQCLARPRLARPLLKSPAQARIFDFFECRQPAAFEGQVWGNWGDPSRFSLLGRVAATNVVLREEPVSHLTTQVYYTNGWVHLTNPVVYRTLTETGRAEVILIDTRAQKLYLSNAVGWVSVGPASRLISPPAARALLPFHFDAPVRAEVNGQVDLKRKGRDHDLSFNVAGPDFRWLNFHFDRILGQVLWQGQTLIITNAVGQLHGGLASGHAHFDFDHPPGALFGFHAQVTNVNFGAFTEQVSGRTNSLEGLLSGTLEVSRAHTADWQSWNGHGQVLLQDGLIWQIPLFGVFSPILNTVVPGLGNSRARQASASYTITNSVIYTRDLEVSATAMRMQFRGQSDFHQNIQGRMEAELLRDMPGVGLVISRVFWPVSKLFEYRLSGTLGQPQADPIYILPRILLLPLNPVKGLRDILLLPFESTSPPPER